MSSNATSSSSSKRKLESATADEPLSKVAKVHPFFSKGNSTHSDDGPLRWLDPLGPSKSCLHATYLSPECFTKVATFDLDGTLIKSTFNSETYEWWDASVPGKLAQIYADGYAIIIISNQALQPASMKKWRLKISSLASSLNIPLRIFAATKKDGYRKPMIGMWTELEGIFNKEGKTVDKSLSFYVGDAAGRKYPGKNKPDFAATDRKWAINVGIPFHTPEEYFLKQPVHEDYEMPGFHASSFLQELPAVTTTSTHFVPKDGSLELVLFVGLPGIGKSSYYRRHLNTYTHVNQDLLGSRPKCIAAVQQAIKEGKSCVIDNTNRNAVTRKYYIDIAKKHNIPIRCLLFTGTKALAWHNNLYRAFNLPPSMASERRDLVPYLVFNTFEKEYEEPEENEGFVNITKVNFVFVGTEEERRHWGMWLQIDEKRNI